MDMRTFWICAWASGWQIMGPNRTAASRIHIFEDFTLSQLIRPNDAHGIRSPLLPHSIPVLFTSQPPVPSAPGAQRKNPGLHREGAFYLLTDPFETRSPHRSFG